MGLIDKLKDLFRDDVPESPKKEKVENYIENKNEAITLISRHLSRYSESRDPNLEVLRLWVVSPATDTQVEWADGNFVRELKTRLHQERIDAIKAIEVTSVSPANLKDLIAGKPNVYPIVADRLYYSTGRRIETAVTAPKAWLECVEGREYVEDPVVALDNTGSKIWNIGRSRNPSGSEVNEIAIKDNCLDISRQQAAIVAAGGRYYLKCKPGGCRIRGGCVTKIERADGRQYELVSLDFDGLPPLDEGDRIQLSKTVFYRFTYTDPLKNG